MKPPTRIWRANAWCLMCRALVQQQVVKKEKNLELKCGHCGTWCSVLSYSTIDLRGALHSSIDRIDPDEFAGGEA